MTHAEDQWTTCPPGEFTRLGARLRGRRRRRHATRAATAIAVLIAGLGFWTLRDQPREYSYAGLRCSRVQELAMDFARGALEPELANRVESHAEQCPRCHGLFEEMGLLSALNLPDLALASIGWLASVGSPPDRGSDTSTGTDWGLDPGSTWESAG